MFMLPNIPRCITNKVPVLHVVKTVAILKVDQNLITIEEKVAEHVLN